MLATWKATLLTDFYDATVVINTSAQHAVKTCQGNKTKVLNPA